MLRDLWLQLPVSPAAASVSSVEGKEVRGKPAWTQISVEQRRRQGFVWREEGLFLGGFSVIIVLLKYGGSLGTEQDPNLDGS